jgi:hypothetical protein
MGKRKFLTLSTLEILTIVSLYKDCGIPEICIYIYIYIYIYLYVYGVYIYVLIKTKKNSLALCPLEFYTDRERLLLVGEVSAHFGGSNYVAWSAQLNSTAVKFGSLDRSRNFFM